MLRLSVLVLALVGGLLAPASAQTGANAFTFVALGDMPYAIPEDYPKVDRLVAAINRLKPAFSIHVGDIKSSSSPCSDEVLRKAIDQISTLEQPVVYSIGDNEWTDCHRESAGRYDPRERLAKVRALAFGRPGMSLGRTPMPVESQAIVMGGAYAKFVENQRFVKNGVVFIVPHVPGSNNGFEARDPAAATEYFERNAANLAWINDGFRLARETRAKAVVIAFQADPYDIRQAYPAMPRASGFFDTVRAITRGAAEFARPVLVIHGDQHTFEVTAFKDTALRPVPNTLKLQVFGDKLVHAVTVVVDPDSPGVFAIAPLIVPENGAF